MIWAVAVRDNCSEDWVLAYYVVIVQAALTEIHYQSVIK